MTKTTLFITLIAALLLTIAGCGEKTHSNKTEAAISAVPAVTVKELTPEEKIAETKRKAEAGEASAQYHLGVMYHNGEGVPYDAAKAVEWHQKAAAQGNMDAQFNLGVMYLNGEGVHKDAVMAVEWLQKAAAQENTNAQFRLGVMYHNGEGVPKDATKAVDWYQKAAARGDVIAQKNLGWMYEKGDGVPKDASKAAEWYQKVAAQEKREADQAAAEADQAEKGAYVTCNNKASCDKAFSLAQIYINTMASQKIQVATDTIIETYNPTENGKIGMGAVKIPGKGTSAEIRLSITCKVDDARLYDKICMQKKLDIYNGFLPFINKMLSD